MRVNESIGSILPHDVQGSVSDYTKRLPNIAIAEVDSKLKKISPLFLRAPPYSPEDSFLSKCTKSVVATLNLLSIIKRETRELLRFQPIASEVLALFKPELERLSEEICNTFFDMQEALFMHEFYQEKLKVVNGEQEAIPKQKLIGMFLESYKEVMKARKYTYVDGKKISLESKSTRADLLSKREKYLEDLYAQLEPLGGYDLEDTNMRLRVSHSMLDRRFDSNIKLNYKLDELHTFLSTPIRFYA